MLTIAGGIIIAVAVLWIAREVLNGICLFLLEHYKDFWRRQ